MLFLSEIPYAFVAGVCIALGLIFGSFLNVVIHRLPRGESLVHPGSTCPACGAGIRAYDNVPVLSFILLLGRARCCRARISPRYPLIELISGLLAWAILQVIVLDLPGAVPWWHALLVFGCYLALGLGLLAAAFIDLEHMILPDEITLGLAVLGFVSVPLRPDVEWLDVAIGAAFGFVLIWFPFVWLYSRLRGAPGMGLGDAKLVMMAGAWFGWRGALFTLLAGAVQGTLAALIVIVTRGSIEEPEAVKREREQMQRVLAEAEGPERERLARELAADPIFAEPDSRLGKARLPFGPFLALALLEYMLLGAWIWDEIIAY